MFKLHLDGGGAALQHPSAISADGQGGLILETSSNPLTGATQLEGSSAWPVAVMDAILMVLILSGNSLTIVSILRYPRLSTASNQFVLGLACADVLVGLTMPYHMMFYLLPSLGEKRGLCLLRFTLITLACSASILHLSAIAADRYLAIVHPLRHAAIVTKRLARRVIAGSWLFAICIATVIIYWNAWEYPGHCDFAGVVPRNYMLCVVMPLFTLLFIVLIVTYVRIQRVAAQQARRLSSPHVHLSTSASHWHSGTKSLQVVSFVLGCFCICWLPYLIIGTLLVMGVHSGELPLAYSLSFSFAMANSCMNPIIYAWKNKDFKCAFRELLSCDRTQREQRGCEAAHHSARGSRASVFRHSSADSNSAPVFSVHLPAGDVSCSPSQASSDLTSID